MKKSGRNLCLCITLALIPLTGCDLDMYDEQESSDYDADDGESSNLDVSEHSLESWRTGRTRTDYPGAVWLEDLGCSGAVIAPDLIMTAAHCVQHIQNTSYIDTRIEAMIDGQRRCISNFTGVDRDCNEVESDRAWVQVFRNTAFQGTDTTTDAAVLKLWAGGDQIAAGYKRPFFGGMAPVTDCNENGARSGKTPCYMRIMTLAPSSGWWIEWSGWGVTRENANDAGSFLNWGHTKIDWARFYHFGRDTAKTDLERGCVGDSGGPAVLSNSNHGLNTDRTFLMGLNIGADAYGHCADAGGKERWIRVDKQLFLVTNSPSDAANPGAGRPCGSYSINGIPYVKCWDPKDWQQQVTLFPTDDSFVRRGYGPIGGSATNLAVKNTGNQNKYDREAYLKFDLRNVQGRLVKAKIGFWAKSQSGHAPVRNAIYAVDDDNWREYNIEWNNKPAAGQKLVDYKYYNETYQYIKHDVTAYVTAQYAADAIVSFKFQHPVVDNSLWYMQSKESSNDPRLMLTLQGQ